MAHLLSQNVGHHPLKQPRAQRDHGVGEVIVGVVKLRAFLARDLREAVQLAPEVGQFGDVGIGQHLQRLSGGKHLQRRLNLMPGGAGH